MHHNCCEYSKTGILTFDACFPDSVVGFQAEDPATVEYVRVWLYFLQTTLESQAPESAQKNINLKILRALEIPDPGAELRRAFAQRVKKVEALKSEQYSALCGFNDLFASLQQCAFRRE